MNTTSRSATLSAPAQQAQALLHSLTERVAVAAQQPGEHDASALAPLAETLGTLIPQITALPQAERTALEPAFTTLMAMLDNAITRLATARDDTAQQLSALRHRANAFSAYRTK